MKVPLLWVLVVLECERVAIWEAEGEVNILEGNGSILVIACIILKLVAETIVIVDCILFGIYVPLQGGIISPRKKLISVFKTHWMSHSIKQALIVNIMTVQ